MAAPRLLLWLSLTACAGYACAPDRETGPADSADSDTEPVPCQNLALLIDGPESPHVDDEWLVLLSCEGVNLPGPYRVQFSDPAFARVDDNNITFLKAGTAIMTVEVGVDSLQQEVKVEYAPCEAVTLVVDGPTAPVVGDEWLVLLACDGASLVGPYVVRFSEPEFAEIEGNELTFLMAGSSTLRVQSGSHSVEEEVTVSEAQQTSE